MVIGVDGPHGRRICSELKAANGKTIIPISGYKSLGKGASVIKGKLYCSKGSKVHEIADLRKAKSLEGKHNWQNAAAAYAAVSALGLSIDEIGKAILNFPGLAHRMETVGEIGPVRFVNDSKATNANAAFQALNAYDNIYWIAGGQAKAEGIAPLSDLFPKISKAYLIGEAAPEFHKTLHKSGVDNKVSGTLEMALLCAARDALNQSHESSIVLLSPACASFDQFKSFEVRGEAFRTQVNSLVELFEREKAEYASRGTAA